LRAAGDHQSCRGVTFSRDLFAERPFRWSRPDDGGSRWGVGRCYTTDVKVVRSRCAERGPNAEIRAPSGIVGHVEGDRRQISIGSGFRGGVFLRVVFLGAALEGVRVVRRRGEPGTHDAPTIAALWSEWGLAWRSRRTVDEWGFGAGVDRSLPMTVRGAGGPAWCRP